jgi:hypothetical protein
MSTKNVVPMKLLVPTYLFASPSERHVIGDVVLDWPSLYYYFMANGSWGRSNDVSLLLRIFISPYHLAIRVTGLGEFSHIKVFFFGGGGF